MARRMLIDASHPEETRVVVVDGTRLEEFDFETASRKPLKGNIYLAKVIRIEPSLQVLTSGLAPGHMLKTLAKTCPAVDFDE